MIDAKDNCGLGSYHGYYFKLIKDIDMTGVTNWMPFNFCGTLDGAGHTISNMQMNQNFYESTDPDNDENKSTEYEAGFFSQLVHAHIKNLYFVNCTATVSDNLIPESDRDIYAAIVAGTAIASGFENVSVVNCAVSQNGKPTNMGYAAGLVAYADICHISNCSVQGGSINVGGSAIDMYTGGLVGAVSDMYYAYKDSYYMQVGAGKDFGIYDSFSTAKISVQNATGTATGGLIGMVECWNLDFTCKNCMVGGTITASNYAAGLIGSCDTSKRRNIDTNAENCVIYSTGIQGGKYADYLYRPDGGNKDVCPVTFTSCKVSDATSVSVTDTESGSITNYGEITSTTLTEVDCQVSDFKSNLHGKLADGTADVTITLSQDGTEKYTAVTDSDGEYNFGKQVLKGDYVLNIASTSDYKAYEDNITINYATNKKLDITREGKSSSVTTVTPTSSAITYGDNLILTAKVEKSRARTTTPDMIDFYVVTGEDETLLGTANVNYSDTNNDNGTATLEVATSQKAFAIGDNKIIAEYGGSVNLNGSESDTITVTLNPKEVGLAWSGYSERKYDGKASNVIATATGVISGDEIDVIVVDGNKVEAGTHVAIATGLTGTYAEYYKLPTNNTMEYTITKKSSGSVAATNTGNKQDNEKDKTDETVWNNPFTDVSESDWFYHAVKYAHQNKLFAGVSATEFAPNMPMSRGMLVTVLYRLAGSPAVTGDMPFDDVNSDAYYRNAILWAVQNNIVSGIADDLFAPDANITREQIAIILYRFAQYCGYDTSVGEDTNILSYDDFTDINEYAITAMQYAAGSGFLNGRTENTLNPQDTATRAEVAAILQRFIEGNK